MILVVVSFVFFFKQKTAYEMRISDWSSDVCSSDLTGICHQVNLEYLSRVVFTREEPDGMQAYPDTLVGTDSHTPMVNGLGVLGWGVGGIEAEAAMLGQPMSMLIPQVVGLKLTGEFPAGTTATDLVLTVAEMLRRTDRKST